jgi:hypothetical protein
VVGAEGEEDGGVVGVAGEAGEAGGDGDGVGGVEAGGGDVVVAAGGGDAVVAAGAAGGDVLGSGADAGVAIEAEALAALEGTDEEPDPPPQDAHISVATATTSADRIAHLRPASRSEGGAHFAPACPRFQRWAGTRRFAQTSRLAAPASVKDHAGSMPEVGVEFSAEVPEISAVHLATLVPAAAIRFKGIARVL